LKRQSNHQQVKPKAQARVALTKVPITAKKTKAEIAFLKKKEERDVKRIREKASVSHKERVEKFNEYLNSLSEHYEPAKVSWTK